MSKEIREQINKINNWKQSLIEGRLKQLNVTNDLLPYIEGAFREIIKNYGNKYDLKGYTLSAFEFDKYHEYCPYGFDMGIDTVNKRIHIDVCSRNGGYEMGGFKETIYDEIEGVLLGSITYGDQHVVKPTKYDLPINI